MHYYKLQKKKNKQKKYGWLNSVHLITFFLSQAYRGLEFMPYENVPLKAKNSPWLKYSQHR